MIKLKMEVQIALIVAIVGICAPESFASCAPPPPFRCSLPASPVAFVGTVISKQDVDLRPLLPPSTNNRGRRLVGDPVPPRDDSYIAVTFRVNESLRGDFDDTIVIRTDPANSSASYRFEIGHDYLVFADLQNVFGRCLAPFLIERISLQKNGELLGAGFDSIMTKVFSPSTGIMGLTVLSSCLIKGSISKGAPCKKPS